MNKQTVTLPTMETKAPAPLANKEPISADLVFNHGKTWMLGETHNPPVKSNNTPMERINLVQTIAQKSGIEQPVLTVSELEAALALKHKDMLSKILSEQTCKIQGRPYIKYDGVMGLMQLIGVTLLTDGCEVERILDDKNHLKGWQYTAKAERLDGSVISATAFVGKDEVAKEYIGISKCQTRAIAKVGQKIGSVILAGYKINSTPEGEIRDMRRPPILKNEITQDDFLARLEKAQNYILDHALDGEGRYAYPEAKIVNELIVKFKEDKRTPISQKVSRMQIAVKNLVDAVEHKRKTPTTQPASVSVS